MCKESLDKPPKFKSGIYGEAWASSQSLDYIIVGFIIPVILFVFVVGTNSEAPVKIKKKAVTEHPLLAKFYLERAERYVLPFDNLLTIAFINYYILTIVTQVKYRLCISPLHDM